MIFQNYYSKLFEYSSPNNSTTESLYRMIQSRIDPSAVAFLSRRLSKFQKLRIHNRRSPRSPTPIANADRQHRSPIPLPASLPSPCTLYLAPSNLVSISCTSSPRVASTLRPRCVRVALHRAYFPIAPRIG